MAVLNLNDTPPPIDNHAFKTQAVLKTSTIFEDELTVSKIKYQVDGMRWTGDYFNQILNVNTQPSAPDINIPETTQKYNRVDKLDIYVSTGLPNGSVTNITGSGVINAGFMPYVGDAFTTTLAGGRIGIFVITLVTKEYYNTHDVFSVEFKLTYFVDTYATIYNDLVFKTVRTYVYDKNAVDAFSTPVILAKDYKIKMDLAVVPAGIIAYYIATFRDIRTKLFVLPTVTSSFVDQLVIDAIFKTLTIRDVPELSEITRLSTNINSETIWDAIIKRDISILSTCNKTLRYHMISSPTSVSQKLVAYTGISNMITDRPSITGIVPIININPLMASNTVEVPITGNRDTYIFSTDFYNQVPTITFSKLETVLLEYLRGGAPNRNLVNELILEYKYWSYGDQYVLTPILLLLINSLVSNTYSAL